jgi:hypothetical protein
MRRCVIATVAVLVAGAMAVPALAATMWKTDTVAQPAGVDFTNFGGAFVASPTEAFAVGSQRQASSSNFTQLIESFNGSGFTVTPGATIPGASSSTLNGAGGSGPNDVWAVGNQNGSTNSTLIEHFNGMAWSLVPSPAVADGTFASVSADSPTDAWAVGGQVIAAPHNTFNTTLTEHWNGSTWQTVANPFGNTSSPLPRDTLVAVDAISPTDVYALGREAFQHGQTSVLENWNGSSWGTVSLPVSGAVLNGLGATGPNDVYVVGRSGVIEHFNGTTWSQVSNPAGTSEDLAGIAALTPTDEWTVSTDGQLTEHGNGSTFTSVPTASPLPAGLRVSDVAGRAGGPLFAVGGNDNGGNNLSTILQQPQP